MKSTATPDNAFTLQVDDDPDLPAINRIVEQCVLGWDLPERVKRLVMPSYRYTPADLPHLTFATVRNSADAAIIGAATWEPADPSEVPRGGTALLLHGLYVAPEYRHRGLGRRLIEACARTTVTTGAGGVLVKAQRDAESYFIAQGFSPLPVMNEQRDYDHRLWKSV